MTWVVIGGLFIVASTVGLVVTELVLARRGTLTRAERLAESTSRMLAEQSFRSIDAVALTIDAVADAILAATDRRAGPVLVRDILRSRTRTTPELRDLAFVPADGTGGIDTTDKPLPPIDLDHIAYARQAIAKPGAISFGIPVAGRHLGESTAEASASGQFYVPMARSIHTSEGYLLGMVVGLLNPDFFATTFDAVDIGTRDAIRLIHYDGQLVATSSPEDGPPGSTMRALPIFEHMLPSVERGTYRLVDPDGVERVTAFRVLRTYPLVISVGLSLPAALDAWRQEAMSLLLLSAAMVALVGAGVFLLWRQIRTLHRRERDLANSEALKSGILSSALDGIVSSDEAGRIIEFNPAAERIFGRSRADVLGAQIEEVIVPPDQRDAHLGGFRRFIETGHSRLMGRRIELPATRADGSVFPAELAITVTQAAGTRVFTAYLRDITQRRRDDAELRAARERADAANRAKSEFLATISHEIRTPMNGIIGMASILQETPLAPDQQRYLQTIQSSSESLLRLINDLLDFSRLEAGRLELEATSFELEALVEEVVGLVAPLAQAQGLILGWRLGAGVPSLVKGDPGRLRQVLVNLLGNAVKFTPHGSVTTTISAAEGAIRFAVTDTGIGIPPDAIGRVFDRFEQVDASITRRFGGTGLGLAIARRLVELMGGRIDVDSRPGEGSTFWFEVPLPAVDLGATPEPASEELPPGPVLVWDADPHVRHLVAAQLRDWGLRADVVADEAEADRKAGSAAGEGNPYRFLVVRLDAHGRKPAPAWMPAASVIALSAIPIPADPTIVSPVQPSTLRRALLGRPRKASSAVAAADGPRPPPEALSVLVAEDNPTNQQIMAMILRRLGHRATLVADGRAALEMAETRPFDLILMDIQMPEMSGIEATRRIRELPPPRGKVPIIAATAMGAPQDRESFLAAGMNDVLVKPITRATVERAIAALFQARAEPPAPSSAAGMPGGGINHAVLAELAAALGPEDLARLIQRLQVQTPPLLSEIARAADALDGPALARAAHMLAGSLRNFGLEGASDLALRVEQLVGNGDLPDACRTARALMEAAPQSVALLRAMYVPASIS